MLYLGSLGCSPESWGSCSGQSIEHLRVGDQQTLNHLVVLSAPAPRAVLSTKQCSMSLFVPAPAAGQCAESCSKQRFARDACVETDSKRTVLRLAEGVHSNFYQNESKSWLLECFIFNKQANMPSLSPVSGAALGKQ